jgi:hypothetical protein
MLNSITPENLKAAIDLHQLWLKSKKRAGVRLCLVNYDLHGFDFSGANLSKADLSKANLVGASLEGANLTGANLTYAILYRANLNNIVGVKANFQNANTNSATFKYANLTKANFANANLVFANFKDANLTKANLVNANLESANLYSTNLERAKLPDFQLPQRIKLIGYKKVGNDFILKLEIPAKAERTASLIGNKCRASEAKVIGWKKVGHRHYKTTPATFFSIWATSFYYRMGETAYPSGYDPDIRVECTSGIHFFLLQSEAKKYRS